MWPQLMKMIRLLWLLMLLYAVHGDQAMDPPPSLNVNACQLNSGSQCSGSCPCGDTKLSPCIALTPTICICSAPPPPCAGRRLAQSFNSSNCIGLQPPSPAQFSPLPPGSTPSPASSPPASKAARASVGTLGLCALCLAFGALLAF